MTRSACSQETVRASNPNRFGSSASPEWGPEPVTTVPEGEHGGADGHGDPAEPGDQRWDERPRRRRQPSWPGEPQVGRRGDQGHRHEEVRGDRRGVEPEQHGDAAEHGLADHAAEHEPRRATFIARRGAAAPDGERRSPAARTSEHAGQRAVAELDVLVEALRLLDRRGDRAVDALGPGRAAQAAAGDPHEAAGHDDADLGDEVGQQDRGQPARRRGVGRPGRRRWSCSCSSRHKATARGAAAREPVSRPSGRTATPAAPPTTPQASEHGPLRPRPAAVDEGRAHRVTQRTRRQQRRDRRRGRRAAASVGTSTPEPEEQHPHEVGHGEHRLGPQGAGEEQGQGHEGGAARGAGSRAAGRSPPASGRAPRARPSAPEHDDLHRERPTARPAPLAASSPSRPSGVVPSRRSTPARRSNPVEMAWPVNAVETTARASAPASGQVDPRGRGRGRAPTTGRGRRAPARGGRPRRAAARRWRAGPGSRSAARDRARALPRRVPRRSPGAPGGQREVDVLERAPAAHLVEGAVGRPPGRRPG